jgi:hypothetical protein
MDGCTYVTPLLQLLENHMFKENKGNRPERQLAALAKQALRNTDKHMSCEAVRNILCGMKAVLYMFRIKFPVLLNRYVV